MCDPEVCTQKCCDLNKDCPATTGTCLYKKVSEFPCTTEMDCPKGWACGGLFTNATDSLNNLTNSTNSTTVNPTISYCYNEAAAAAMAVLVICCCCCFLCLPVCVFLGCLVKHYTDKSKRQDVRANAGNNN